MFANKERSLKEYRRQQSTLVCAGIGVIVLSLWDVINFLLYLLFGRETLMNFIYEADSQDEQVIVAGVVFAAVLFLLLINLFFRMQLGKTAIRYGRGIPIKHPIVFNLMIIVFTFWQIGSIHFTITQKGRGLGMANRIMSLIAGITSLSIFVEMIIASIKLRRFDKEMNNKEEKRCS